MKQSDQDINVIITSVVKICLKIRSIYKSFYEYMSKGAEQDHTAWLIWIYTERKCLNFGRFC